MLLVVRGIGDSLFSYQMKGIIYIATNLFNGRSYIGQTRASLSRRKEQHIRDAVSDSVNHFHLALMQYGRDAFEWKILDEFEGTKEEVIHALNVAEEYHILKNRTMLDEYGYNATGGGYSSDKFADTIKKRALVNYGGKAVLQYDLEGNFVREFESIADVKRSFGNTYHKGRHFIGRIWRGYQWREKLNEYYPRKISAYIPSTPTKGVVVYSQDGNFYKEYDSIKACRRELGVSYKVRDSIGDVTIKSYMVGIYFVFKRPEGGYPDRIHVDVQHSKNSHKKAPNNAEKSPVGVLQYSRDGILIKEYPSMTVASTDAHVACSTIRASIKRPLPYIVDVRAKYVWRIKSGDAPKTIDVILKEKYQYIPKSNHRVVQYDKDGQILKIWKNMYQAALQTGESHNLIRKQCLGIPTKKKTPSLWKYYVVA